MKKSSFMSPNRVEVLSKYTEAIGTLIDERLFPSKLSIKDTLSINRDEYWSFIITCRDIINDTSMAISNFLKFGLGGPTKYEDMGEKYLRLYGTLNAIYLQQQAVTKLYTLMNVPNAKKIIMKVKSLAITDVRHKLGAHSTNYENSDKQIKSYSPVRISMSDFGCSFINYEGSEISHINLNNSIGEHLELMIEILDKTYEKTFNTLYKSNRDKIAEFTEKLKELRILRDGGAVMDLQDGRKLIIHTMGEES